MVPNLYVRAGKSLTGSFFDSNFGRAEDSWLIARAPIILIWGHKDEGV